MKETDHTKKEKARRAKAATAKLLDIIATTTPMGEDDTGTFTVPHAYLLAEKHGLLHDLDLGSRPLGDMGYMLDAHAGELLRASDGNRYYYTHPRLAGEPCTLHLFNPLPKE